MAGKDYSQVPIEERPRQAKEPQIGVPSLNIFLGSTPAHAALEVMRGLVRLSPSDRRKVALVFLDIDQMPLEVHTYLSEHPGVFKTFELRIEVAKGVDYADDLRPEIATHTYIPNKIPESFDNGAGGIRNNGHVAACSDRAKIEQELEAALTAIGALPPDRDARPVTEIAINIVSFLGGGTGSGILGDIAVMARQHVLGLDLTHRLNIFCLLPEHLGESTVNEVSWRKSNATATLMELVALSLASGSRSVGRTDGFEAGYVKYLQSDPYDVRGTTIANEVYLYGNTSMTSAEDAARIIGIDLLTRITNDAGVGYLERSKAVDRRSIGNFDAKGIPTMFSYSCPLEVYFPADETADAFAKRLAAKVLPEVARVEAQDGSALSSDELRDVKTWDDAFDPGPQPAFTERNFMTAGRDRLDALAARLNQQVEAADAQIEQRVREREVEQRRKIDEVRHFLPGEQKRRLQSLNRVYTTALNRARDLRIPTRTGLDPDLQRRILRAPTWLPMWMPGSREQRVDAVADDFNKVQRLRIRKHFLKRRIEVLQELVDTTTKQLARVDRFLGAVDDGAIERELEREALALPAWRGELGHAHVHRRHLFDLPGIPGMNNGERESPPVKRLYDFLTTKTPADYATDFVEWRRTHADDVGMADGRPRDFRTRLVDYLRDEVYLPELDRRNLFELLQLCCVSRSEDAEAKVQEILRAHLQHISGLARPLVAFEAQLWTDGGGQLDTSLYLGISWADDRQRLVLERAKNQLGQIGRQGQKPRVASAIDPHRLQLVYGQHGISLGTIPDFYQESNSAMAAFLFHQNAWAGGRGRPYGDNKAPVLSCGEMERLVMDPSALGDTERRNLPSRLIRRRQRGAGQAPNYVATSQQDGGASGGGGPRRDGRADGRPGEGDGRNAPYGGYRPDYRLPSQ